MFPDKCSESYNRVDILESEIEEWLLSSFPSPDLHDEMIAWIAQTAKTMTDENDSLEQAHREEKDELQKKMEHITNGYVS